jgi:ADP-heptose:LPS heptosyltransferase
LPHKSKHIAVIRLSAMGDVAMTVPVILALVKQHPNVKITLVSRPFFKPFFDTIPNVTFLSVHTHHRHKGLLGIYRLYKDLKKEHVEAIADLHNVLRSKIVRFLFSLSRKSIACTDKGRGEKKALTSLDNKDFRPLKSMIERHVETFKKLGYAIDLSTPVFLKPLDLSESVKEILGDKNCKWIGIAPFAHYKSKTYPSDLMQQVITELSKEKPIKIALFGGGKHEKELLDKMAEGLENVYNFTKVISFEEELQLISNLDLMVSMDSGNAHIAAMYGVKTITLWGATHPYAGFMPYNQPMENCLVSDRTQYPLLPTSVYGDKKVEGYEDAMRTISVNDIIQKINSNLA